MMLRVDTSSLINTAISNAQAAKSTEKSVVDANEVAKEINSIASPSSINAVPKKDEVLDISNEVSTRNIDDISMDSSVQKIEKKVSILQKAADVLSEESKMIRRTKEMLSKYQGPENDKASEKKILDELKQLVTEINSKYENTKFEGSKILDGTIKEIPTINSDELGLTNASTKYVLNNVRVGGESYVPNYSFDISTLGGGSAALSVLESAISKIDSIKQKISISINELIRYPEILDLDRMEYSGAQSRVRNVNTAKMLVSQLKSNIRQKINQVQSAQNVQKNIEIINLLTRE